MFYKGQRIQDGDVSIGYESAQSTVEETEVATPGTVATTREEADDELLFSIFHFDKVVGGIELHDIAADKTEVLIGYRNNDTSLHNKGIGTKALKMIRQFAIDEMQIKSLVVITESNNIGSRKICEKSGFSYAGTAREGDHLVVYEFRAKQPIDNG